MMMSRAPRVWPTSVLALALFAATAWMFYPGYLSFDSSFQWYQVRTGNWDNVHPVIMTMIWSATDWILPGPAGYFLLQLLAYWSGVAWLVTRLYDRPALQCTVLLALGLFPPVFSLVPHLWKDIGLLVAVVWAVALLIEDSRRPRRGLRAGSLALLALACAYRHNALPLAVPLIWYLTGREPRLSGWLRRSLATVAALVAIAIVASIPNRWPGVDQREVWPVTALWDLTAVSIAEDRVLLPPEWIDPTLTVDELRTHFVPYANVPIFETGKIRDSISWTVTDAQSDALDRAWLSLWTHHFGDYAWHRARLTALLFGIDQTAVPNTLILQPGVLPLADNPPISREAPALQRWWNAGMEALLDTPLYAFWVYVLVALVIAAAATRRVHHPLLWPVLLSAFLYVLPLPLVAPSAEWRYLIWPVFATPLALMLLLHRPRPPIARP